MKLVSIKQGCQKCGKRTKEDFCNSCFVKVFEKRIRKQLRSLEVIKYPLFVVDDVSEFLMKRILKSPVKVERVRLGLRRFGNNVYVNEKLLAYLREHNNAHCLAPITADDMIEALLSFYFAGDSVKKHSRIHAFLEPVTNEELTRYTTIKKLSLSKETSDVLEMVGKLDRDFVGTKHSLLSTIQELRKHKLYK